VLISLISDTNLSSSFPVNFNNEDDNSRVGDELVSIEIFADNLKKHIPELFDGKYLVITEYGRYYNAKSGFIVSKVEYTKVSGGRHIALIHAGADLFVRTVWLPTKWAIRVRTIIEDMLSYMFW
jgi:diaminopimelate decarboxylase